MKNFKIMLFGIALILLGIALKLMFIEYVESGFLLVLERVTPFIGIIVTAIGLFLTDYDSK
ncbi:hypothetical protein CDQ84_17590 [Clostridium thermosuccinogenes]|jgi:hypothetical protein|uniref:Uncharacterized protein n=1 Tax=Clostridium thermosuccinogenes TaxID=84032 RepID=A0A2K2F790_9CLOT|nr:hypothetical protein [Pseudoclostridium thermosuccinogenes]AUS96085.1 hypothetical protein CDO33_06320 [Pseudoclostridium thermosuccinogenes]PNT94630.1 hypothetical protein CDQ85_17570 [Pseudoclostridium thermosuccinogenes]PNT95147.1 hypothetical protein CDQ84_17590 [Pseudoclostridium thermosuccinogenes]